MPSDDHALDLAGAKVHVFPDAESATRFAADLLALSLQTAVKARGKAILGLATGATPVSVYARLVSLHRSGELLFADVTSYNLDEYYPIHPSDPNSYRCYMYEHLFGHVDIPANRCHVFDGTVPEAFTAHHAAEFDRWIEAEGGLDVQLLGVGRNGHIGFNEPSGLTVEQALSLPSRLVNLHPTTITDASKDFGTKTRVIRRALTLGIATILASRSVLVLALGSSKNTAVREALVGPMTAGCPASLLQSIPGKVTWILDAAAASGLVCDP